VVAGPPVRGGERAMLLGPVVPDRVHPDGLAGARQLDRTGHDADLGAAAPPAVADPIVGAGERDIPRGSPPPGSQPSRRWRAGTGGCPAAAGPPAAGRCRVCGVAHAQRPARHGGRSALDAPRRRPPPAHRPAQSAHGNGTRPMRSSRAGRPTATTPAAAQIGSGGSTTGCPAGTSAVLCTAPPSLWW
jgi:hypothetical protein